MYSNKQNTHVLCLPSFNECQFTSLKLAEKQQYDLWKALKILKLGIF